MSEIKAGDLVVIVRWPCCGHRLGNVFRVESILSEYQFFHCDNCGAREQFHEAIAWNGEPGGVAARLSWLRRIPPLSELTDETRREEITA